MIFQNIFLLLSAFIDCTWEMTSEGTFNCTRNEEEMKTYCEFSCGEFEEYTPSPVVKYVCNKKSQWIPHTLPHCVAAGSRKCRFFSVFKRTCYIKKDKHIRFART